MQDKHSQVVHLRVDDERNGQRIDNFLLAHLKGVPKAHIYKILRSGEVRVNKGRVKPNYKVRAGDSVRVPPVQTQVAPALAASEALLERVACAVIYQDEQLLVIDKPAGLAVHGGSGLRNDLTTCLRLLYPGQPVQIAHRLDRQTSGCLVCGKNPASVRALTRAFQTDAISKSYLALVQGQWRVRGHVVELGLQKQAGAVTQGKMRVDEEGKASRSIFTTEKILRDATLMQVELHTGRTHQIRVHAAACDHPVAGDDRYGNRDFNVRMAKWGLNRLFLHASSITIGKDVLGKRLEFTSELPEDLAQVLQKLGSAA